MASLYRSSPNIASNNHLCPNDGTEILKSETKVQGCQLFQGFQGITTTFLMTSSSLMLKDEDLDVYMRRAFELAREALDAHEVPIGCLIVNLRTGQSLAHGRNRTNEGRDATRHAELEALAMLTPEQRSQLSECGLLVTVEPCIMCIAALRMSGIRKVWTAAMNEKFGGCGSVASAHTDMMPERIPAAEVSVLRKWRARSIRLLRQFYVRENGRAPCPRRKDKRQLKEVSESEECEE